MRTHFLGMVALLLLAVTPQGVSVAGPPILVAPDAEASAAGAGMAEAWEKSLPSKQLVENGITFNLAYQDAANQGFNDPAEGAVRQARLEDVLAYVADVINTTGTLDVRVNVSQFDGSGPLAWAGTYYGTSPGFQSGAVYTRLSSGTKPFPAYPEIEITVDFGYSWYFGTGKPAVTQLDAFSVLVHEITHGLGFATLSKASGASNAAAGVYTVFDQFLRRDSSGVTLFSGTPPVFQGAAADLVSNDVVFTGTLATAYYGQSVNPGIFAPSLFIGNSSLQHWDSGHIVGGGVMEPVFLYGEVKRAYRPLDIGALLDLGYSNAAEPAHLAAVPDPADTLAFGTVIEGQTLDEVVTIQNTGDTGLSGTATVTGKAFTLVGAVDYTLGTGESIDIAVHFAPTHKGLYKGSLNLSGDPTGLVSFALTGTGASSISTSCGPAPGPASHPLADILIMLAVAVAIALGTRAPKHV